jgi:hypothetical protein
VVALAKKNCNLERSRNFSLTDDCTKIDIRTTITMTSVCATCTAVQYITYSKVL